MGIQKKHVVLWLIALLVLLCAWTTAFALGGDYKTYSDGCVVDESDPSHKVLARYEGTETKIPKTLFTDHDIKVVGASAFYGNQVVTEIHLPDGIEAIYVRAFADCPNLKAVTLFENNSKSKLKLIPNECFQDCPMLEEMVIPEGITSIGDRAFENCITLRRVKGPTLVKDRTDRDFWPIPSSVVSVGTNAFNNCPKVVLTCFKGSAPETYAIANGIRYESINAIVEGIRVEDSEGELLQITVIAGQTVKITPTIRPAISVNIPLAWSSGDRSIARVDENGNVTGVKEGICYVTIASEDINQIKQYSGNRIGEEYSIKIVVLSSTGSPWRTPGDGNWYYRMSSTSYGVNFQKIGAHTFHFNKYGHMSIGWKRRLSGNKDYFFLPDPALNNAAGAGVYGRMITGWYQADWWEGGSGYADWYYFDDDGAAHKGWMSVLDSTRSTKKKKYYDWYYFRPGNGAKGGVMETGLIWIDNTPYFFNPAPGAKMGMMAQAGWVQRPGSGAWYYASAENGKLVRGWIQLKGKWYYLDEATCEMAANEMRLIGGRYFCFNSAGEMVTGWRQIGGLWYYFDTDSGAAHAGWLKLKNTWYYFRRSDNVMVTGKQTIDGVNYVFDASGALVQ